MVTQQVKIESGIKQPIAAFSIRALIVRKGRGDDVDGTIIVIVVQVLPQFKD